MIEALLYSNGDGVGNYGVVHSWQEGDRVPDKYGDPPGVFVRLVGQSEQDVVSVDVIRGLQVVQVRSEASS